MAKQTTKSDDASLSLVKAKVKRLVIKNFRSIGRDQVSIDLDEIVVLVGPNNAGKSTILRAYEVIMLQGSADGRLRIDDFPAEQVNPDELPEIELHTYVWDDLPAEKWLHIEPETDKKYVKERWRWDGPNVEPKRQGHLADADDWSDEVPWGAPNVANARRPIPHRVDAFSRPEDEGDKIVKLIQTLLNDRVVSASMQGVSEIETLSAQIAEIQRKIVEDSRGDIDQIQNSLTNYISEIFLGFQVVLDTKPDSVTDKAVTLFAAKPVIRMGPDGGHMAPLDKQGSGARRTLLWSALKIASERQSPSKKPKKKGEPGEDAPQRPHVLLLDEPEICLHPAAIRDACRVLYDLASEDNGWQVMVTTHSPAFIDVSRDNTTIVRVERGVSGSVIGTTVFRPDKVKLSDSDKELLKLLNQWDPYVGEFFFGGKSIIVEGDTEYSAFREIMNQNPTSFRGIHIIRARGKFIIPILIRILGQFGARFAVLHDTDTPKAGERANPAWTANEHIRAAATSACLPDKIRLAASIRDFEHAMFGTSASSDKPYRAYVRVKEDATAQKRVKWLLEYLSFERDDPPAGVIEWDDIDQLSTALAAEPVLVEAEGVS